MENITEVNASASLISAVYAGDLQSIRRLVCDYDSLSCCEAGNTGYILLFVAIKLGYLDIAKFLVLQDSVIVDRDTDCATTPLHLAVEQRSKELVDSLLKKNSPVNARDAQNETALHVAARIGCTEIVRILLDNDASFTVQTNDGFTPLLFAMVGKHSEVVHILLEHACMTLEDEDAHMAEKSFLLDQILLCNRTARNKAHKLVAGIVLRDDEQSKMVDDLIQHGFVLDHKYVNRSLLFSAVKKNYSKLIQNIIMNGPVWPTLSETEYSCLLLHTAARNKRQEIIQLLLNSGFDVNGCICHSLECDREDECIEIMQQLFAGGAILSKTPELLCKAIDSGFVNVCALIVGSGVDFGAMKASAQQSLLRLASEKGHKELMKILRINGVNLDATFEDGETTVNTFTM